VASPAEWLAGARPRTLPAALAPVLAGTGVAAWTDGAVWWKAALALVVSLALQVGVNYANDYSDGIRGTDSARVGPLRLVGSGLARPARVKTAAFGCFGIAGLAGLVLVWALQQWWLLVVGVACILAAWYYTGGKRPYGYRALGEVFVFVFFGLVATCGTGYVQLGYISPALAFAGVGVGALACAILVANNLRDIAGDRAVGKRTLATRVGDRRTRWLYLILIAWTAVMIVMVAALTSWWALLGLTGLILTIPAIRIVITGGTGPSLIAVLKATSLTELLVSVSLSAGLVIATM